MKKIIIFNCYFGDDVDSPTSIISRLSYVVDQMGFLYRLVDMNFRDENATVVIVGTFPVFLDDVLRSLSREYGFFIDFRYVSRVNVFEYIGLTAVRDYSSGMDANDLVFYCHSKGVVNKHRNFGMGIFKLHLIVNLSIPMDIICSNELILKVGLFPSRFGWLWHNFFWIKAGCMTSKSVRITERRHHYEELIGERKNPQAFRACVSLISRFPALFNGKFIEYFEAADLSSNIRLTHLYELLSDDKCTVFDEQGLRKLIDTSFPSATKTAKMISK